MTGGFETALAKLRRAEEHLEGVRKEILAWHDATPYSVQATVSPDGTRHSMVVHFAVDLPAVRISILTGDCIHALRSALDHLVYGVAVHQTGADPPPNERQIQFPIADDEARFTSAAKTRLKGLSPELVKAIEAVQPYNRPHAAVPPLLALLRDFDDADKHRLLNVVVSAQAEAKLLSSIRVPAGETTRVSFNEGPLENGAETFVVETQTPQPELKLNVAPTFAVAVRHPQGPNGAEFSEVWALLSYIRDEVRRIVDDMAARTKETVRE